MSCSHCVRKLLLPGARARAPPCASRRRAPRHGPREPTPTKQTARARTTRALYAPGERRVLRDQKPKSWLRFGPRTPGLGAVLIVLFEDCLDVPWVGGAASGEPLGSVVASAPGAPGAPVEGAGPAVTFPCRSSGEAATAAGTSPDELAGAERSP